MNDRKQAVSFGQVNFDKLLDFFIIIFFHALITQDFEQSSSFVQLLVGKESFHLLALRRILSIASLQNILHLATSELLADMKKFGDITLVFLESLYVVGGELSLGYLDDFGDFLVVLDQVVGLGE